MEGSVARFTHIGADMVLYQQMIELGYHGVSDGGECITNGEKGIWVV